MRKIRKRIYPAEHTSSTMIPVITVSSHKPPQSYYCYDEFFETCRAYGNSPINLCRHPSEYRNLVSKPKLLQKYLLAGNVKHKYLIFSDCWDVVFVESPEKILERFLTLNTSIVFNAQRTIFPYIAELVDKYPDTGTPFRYLNSGFFVGETEAVIALLKHMKLENVGDDYRKPDGSMHHENDQDNFMRAFVEQPVPMKIDFNCEIAQTLHGEVIEDFEVTKTDKIRVKNKITNAYPMALHGNGSGKESVVMLEFLRLWRQK